jgi:hypothetical protein
LAKAGEAADAAAVGKKFDEVVDSLDGVVDSLDNYINKDDLPESTGAFIYCDANNNL